MGNVDHKMNRAGRKTRLFFLPFLCGTSHLGQVSERREN